MIRTALICGFLLLAVAEPALPEGCGAADPAYIRTANETGGIPMFLQRSEAAKSFHLVRETTRSNMSTVFWGAGSLDAQRQTADLPVDSLTQRITFAASFDSDGGGLTLIPPRGSAITQNSANAEITELRCGRIVTVVGPEPGNWHVELTGRGRFWLDAQAQSVIHTVSREFVREGGRPGHEGLFRIDGQPVSGKPATIRAVLSLPGIRSAEFYLANERGERIQKLEMRSVDDAREEFVGTASLPNVPFRVVVAGLDSTGREFQRFFAHLYHSEDVEVSWNRAFDELPVGTVKQAQFSIRNGNQPRSFKVTVTDARQFVARVEPKVVTLGPGQSGSLVIDLTAPAGTEPGVGDDVVVVATSTEGPATSNSSVAHFSVIAPRN